MPNLTATRTGHRGNHLFKPVRLRTYIDGWNKRAHPVVDQDRRRNPQECESSNNFKSSPRRANGPYSLLNNCNQQGTHDYS